MPFPACVLLVEDNPASAHLTQLHLREHTDEACQVTVAPTLASALVLLERLPVDMVLLDLELPDSVGLETYHALCGPAGDKPVVILAVVEDPAEGIAAIHAGAEDYLVKPGADPTALLRAIRNGRARCHRREQRHLADAGRQELPTDDL